MAEIAASTVDDLAPVAPEWNALAEKAASPFLTVEWLTSLWEAYGGGEPACLLARGSDGALLGGSACHRSGRELSALANVHSGDWDVVAVDERSRAVLWQAIADASAGRAVFYGLLANGQSVELGRAALQESGYRLVAREGPRSPYLSLPSTWEELLAARSRNLRSQLGRRKRALQKQGALDLRTCADPDEVRTALETFLRIEASGWKGRTGTAILEDPPAERLYRAFAARAAERGWLRIHLLELEGQAIAADLGCVFGGGAFLLKTGFDERYGDVSPGLLLRAEVLRAAIEEEGARFYDFLGPPDPYKLRWTNEVRPRLELRAYRGARELPRVLVRSWIRPVARRALKRA